MPKAAESTKPGELTPAPPRVEPEAEVTISEHVKERTWPLLDKMRVVYLGRERNHSVAMRGRIYIESVEGGPELRSVSMSGTESYDFSTHDSQGHLLRERLRPAEAPEDERGRPAIRVAHPEHLRRFMRAKDERGDPIYKLVGPASQVRVFEEWLARRERFIQGEEKLTETVMTFADRR